MHKFKFTIFIMIITIHFLHGQENKSVHKINISSIELKLDLS